ncbi:Aldo/keto reductase [Russula emetica]|nr:Aldo/keto reductase [Russula emetica]
MSFFTSQPPISKLARYRTLSPLAGVRVSPIQLGAMSIGGKWNELGMGSMDKEGSFKLLDAYFDLGVSRNYNSSLGSPSTDSVKKGNFIDTANSYQDETSEEFIGEWSEKRGIRDQLVIATKYSTNFKRGKDEYTNKVNYSGNHAKSLHISVEASLKKLRTSYIDILYVHWWDWTTSVEEIMNALHNLVVQGKVLYLGISDTPAWIVPKANQYAKDHGKTPFSIYQGKWSVLERSFERDIIPMARAEGLALAPWGVLEGGKIRSDAEEARRRETGEKGRTVFNPNWERTEEERKICLVLEEVAKEVGVESITPVAIAHLMHKTPYVFPIVGGRKVEHLKQNIQALDISLSPEQIHRIDDAKPFDFGFPYNIIGDRATNMPFAQHLLNHNYDAVPAQGVITPSKN